MAPAAAAISASAMVAHLCFLIPSDSASRTISAILWVLTCGRSRSGLPATAIMSWIFLRTCRG